MADLTGKTSGYLTVLGRAPKKHGIAFAQWHVRCVCGTTLTVGTDRLACYVGSKNISCGCRKSEMYADSRGTHGHSKHPLWSTWKSMIDRCANPKNKNWHRYGGRGISVCQRWRESFPSFASDMGPKPSEKYELERKNNNLGYSPENCEWATHIKQSNNKELSIIIDTPKGRMTIAEAARTFSIQPGTLYRRHHAGWVSARMFDPPRSTTSSTAGRATVSP